VPTGRSVGTAPERNAVLQFHLNWKTPSDIAGGTMWNFYTANITNCLTSAPKTCETCPRRLAVL
jgi:hypothetical protein